MRYNFLVLISYLEHVWIQNASVLYVYENSDTAS